MQRSRTGLWLSLVLLSWISSSLQAQQQAVPTTAPQPVVPRLIKVAGSATDTEGKALNGTVGITFAIYKDHYEGAPLWLETQNVQADTKGNYTVQLGATKSEGLPLDLFSSGDARWLGVSVNGGEEQPRVLLLSVPYALKAADAETINGMPPSAFVLATPSSAGASTSTASGSSAGSLSLTGSGTTDFVPLWTSSTNLGNSIMFEDPTNLRIGINTTTPATSLDVKGAGTVRGLFSLPAIGAANSTVGQNSQALNWAASAFNSGTGKAVSQNFRLQAEPTNNDKATASGTLNLLFGQGTSTPAETGLKIASNGKVTFASGQTFPGTGTVTNVGLSAPSSDFKVTGSPVTKTGTLALSWNVAPTNADTANTIVKRDSTGSFNAGAITATLGLTAVSSGSGGTIVGTNSGTSGGSDGVDGVTSSATASGVAGVNTSGSAGGVGVYGTGGIGVFGIGTIPTFGYGGNFVGYTAPSGSGTGAGDAIFAQGGNSDPSFSGGGGGFAVFAKGGTGPFADGAGGFFEGGNSTRFGDGIDAYPGSGYAGYFGGDVDINGTIYTGAKDFKIDHPLDPANKYLLHASVESSEMMNIYTGNVTTDAQGEAIVPLPDWFEVLNTDFRYQLTVIGQFAQAIIAREISGHQFSIQTSLPNVKVSWQVTGVRQDAFAKAHPLVVEQEKSVRERGYYLHPELYGAPPEKQLEWARHPQLMRQIKEMGAKRLAAAQKPQQTIPNAKCAAHGGSNEAACLDSAGRSESELR